MSGHAEWRMRKTSGPTFGPVSLGALQAWARDGRIAPKDEICEGDGPWRCAGNVPDLGMEWLLELPGGELYGPVPLAAFLDMLREGAIAPAFRVRRRDDVEFRRLGDVAAEAGVEPEPKPEAPRGVKATVPPPAASSEGAMPSGPVEATVAPSERDVADVPSVPQVSGPAPRVRADAPDGVGSPLSAPPASQEPLVVPILAATPEVPASPATQPDAVPAVSRDNRADRADEKPMNALSGPMGSESPPETPPKPASRISPPDEARMLSELQSALGVGRRFRVFDRLRPGRSG